MPYSKKISGIYAIINRSSGKVYIGQSRNILKRISDHFNLLEKGKHPNPKLQNSFNKWGRSAFEDEIVAWMDEESDLNDVEGLYLTGEASLGNMSMYNIAISPTSGMAGRKHTEEAKHMMSIARKGKRDHITEAYIKNLCEAQTLHHLNREGYTDLVKRIISLRRSGVVWKEIGWSVGTDASTACKKYHKYKDMLL